MNHMGERANEPMVMYGHREVVLESTETPSWAPGHAEWKCLACGLTGQTQADMQRKDCAS